MRTFLVLLVIVEMATSGFAAEPRTPPSPGGSTNNLIILNDEGVEVDRSSAKVVYHGNVRVFQSDMYMECELLTLQQETNNPVRTQRGGLTNLNSRIHTIIAETNLLLIARDTTVLGDRATYTKSNEVVVVTGDLVVIKTPTILFYATNFVFNRVTGAGHAVGWTVTEVELGESFAGTNALKGGFSPLRKTNAPVTPPKTNSTK